MRYGYLFKLGLVPIGILSAIKLAMTGYGFSIDRYLLEFIKSYDDCLAILLGPVKDALQDFINYISPFRISIYAHWKHVFVLCVTLFSTVNQAVDRQTGFWQLWINRALRASCALFAAIGTGTLPLAHAGTFFWPLSGLLLYLSLGPARTRSAILAVALLAMAMLTAALAIFTLSEPSFLTWVPENYPLLGFAVIVTATSTYLLLFGLKLPHLISDGWIKTLLSDPARRAGLNTLATFGAAAFLLALNQTIFFRSDPLCPECPNMVEIDGGKYVFGLTEKQRKDAIQNGVPAASLSNDPAPRTVSVAPFKLSERETTISQFSVFARETRHEVKGPCWGYDAKEKRLSVSAEYSWKAPGFATSAGDPVVCVSVSDAIAYVSWLSAKTGRTYRLPTEEEWEFVARMSGKDGGSWNWPRDKVCQRGNVLDAGAVERQQWRSTEMSLNGYFECDDKFSFPAYSPFWAIEGSEDSVPPLVADIVGNVSEITSTCRSATVDEPSRDSAASANASNYCAQNIVRGASWATGPKTFRLTGKQFVRTNDRFGTIGFRVVEEIQKREEQNKTDADVPPPLLIMPPPPPPPTVPLYPLPRR